MLYTALLQHLGCTAYAHEVARVWGDDIVTTRVSFLSDSGELADMWRVWIPGIAKATGRSKAQGAGDHSHDRRRMEAEVQQRPAKWREGPRKGLGCPSRSRPACRTCLRCGTARAFQALLARRSRWPRGSCRSPSPR